MHNRNSFIILLSIYVYFPEDKYHLIDYHGLGH
jgi:hypothetical protein